MINGAGHYIYADKPDVFNQLVVDACQYKNNGSVGDKLAIMSAEDSDTK